MKVKIHPPICSWQELRDILLVEGHDCRRLPRLVSGLKRTRDAPASDIWIRDMLLDDELSLAVFKDACERDLISSDLEFQSGGVQRYFLTTKGAESNDKGVARSRRRRAKES